MAVRQKYFRVGVLVLSLAMALACSTVGGSPDPSAVQTGIAAGIMATEIANQQATLQALQAQATWQAGNPAPAQPPTQFVQPPVQNIPPTTAPSQPPAPSPAPLVLEILTSLDTFYCYQEPTRLTITVRVSDINRGMAVYYHIEDKYSGVTSDIQMLDLHRKTSDTRSATIIGGWSNDQNLQFPPLMSESYFLYQIISDDGTFRSPVYSDVTFFPCAQ